MKASLDNRSTLVRLIERMSDVDVRQMLTYATGYEAGRISQIPLQTSEQSRKPPNADTSITEVGA